jgi:paraquat-inducible protein B
LPLIAALIGAWLVFKTFAEQGPLISIRFENAEGIQPSKTLVKYKDVQVGLVEHVRFTADMNKVVVDVRLDKSLEDKVTDSTRFWVVRPRVEGLRISGLQTLISGAYITMDLGNGGALKERFEGLEEPRSILSDTPGSFYTLKASGLGSLSVGAPVYFRQIAVGEVVKYRLSDDHNAVEIDIFVQAPHDVHVRERTRFWNVSGVELDLSASGLKVGIESLTSLLVGGVAFQTQQSLDVGRRAAPGSAFPLYDNKEDSKAEPITFAQYYVLHFDDSLRGLSEGAPVEFRGLRIGTVSDIGFEGNLASGIVRTPVIIAIEPERVPLAEVGEGDDFESLSTGEKQRRVRRLIDLSVKDGMRARLETGNLLTGQLFVNLDFVADAPPMTVSYGKSYPEIPTVPSLFRGMTHSFSRILASLEQLPLAQIGDNLQQATAGASDLLNSEELKRSLAQLHQVIVKLNRLAATLDAHADPLLNSVTDSSRELKELLVSAEKLVKTANGALGSFNTTVASDGPVASELIGALAELSAAARSIRLMAEYLERHPEALIRGKGH